MIHDAPRSVAGTKEDDYGHTATARGLHAFLNFFPKDSGWNWTVLASTVLERGGNLSIGLGDYHYRQGAEEPPNAQLGPAPRRRRVTRRRARTVGARRVARARSGRPRSRGLR